MTLVKLFRVPAGHAFVLMAMRSTTIAAKFALTLFITRYLGLAELGVYGIITGISAVAPVALGFGVANNLGREGARTTPAAITLPILQYFLFLCPVYAALCAAIILVWPDRAAWLCLLGVVLFLEHLQTELTSLMTILGNAYRANILYFIRFAGWAALYVPLAMADPALRNLTSVLLFWLGGCIVATVLGVLFTRHWRWDTAMRALPTTPIRLPHKYGSMPLYFGDLANVSFVYLDRYVVGLFLSPTALGIYVLYWSITNALSNLVTTSFVQIQRGLLVKVASASDRSLNRPLGRICLTSGAMSLALSMAATLMMYVVVPHLGRPEAEAYLPLMFVLSAALVLRTLYEVVGISFYAYGRDDLVLYSVIGVLLVALTLNLWFDPRVGIWGAGGALVASYAIGWVGRTVMMLRGFRLRPRPDRKAPAAISGMANGRS